MDALQLRSDDSSSSTRSEVEIASTQGRRTWPGQSQWLRNPREVIARVSKNDSAWSLFMLTASYMTLVVLVISLLYSIIFIWQPRSQYNLATHNFVSENEAGQVDGLSRWTEDFSRSVIPIMCHSHNDYWRPYPLFSALAAGCTGVEADVWLTDDEQDLMVGHDRKELRPERTLKSMYLDPLLTLLDRQNPPELWENHTVYDRAAGVFPSQPNQTLVLMIDVKSDPQKVWRIVNEQLRPLRERQFLMHYQRVFPAPGFIERQSLWPAPVTIVASGNFDFQEYYDWQNSQPRWHSDDPWEEDVTDQYSDLFIDGPLGTLPENNTFGTSYDADGRVTGTWGSIKYGPDFTYYASTSFKQSIGEVKFGFSEKQLARLRAQIWTAKKSQLKSRYWDLPSWPISYRDYVWEVLTREGVDMLSVDDLESAARRSWSKGYLASVIWMIVASALVAVGGGLLLFMMWTWVRRQIRLNRAHGDVYLS